MLRINTFGGLSLRQGDAPLTGAPSQRRRLALLAILAAAGDQGVSRERIQAMLWPESDAEKSRHALNQILYAQRRDFAEQQLFNGQKTVRLNPALITSDVALFRNALGRGDLETAVSLYAGPFLDGFFIKGSPEFEAWTSNQRARLENLLADSLETAARRAHESGDHQQAIKWRRCALELDAIDASRALRLAESFVLAGNRAGALRVLHDCQKRIKDSLGVSGDPSIATQISALTAELSE